MSSGSGLSVGLDVGLGDARLGLHVRCGFGFRFIRVRIGVQGWVTVRYTNYKNYKN